jgi:uncharacterized protein
MHLPDINVWLALVFNQHQHHPAAKLWFDSLPVGSRVYFCRYTQLGFLRLSTNPAANPLQTQTMVQAWAIYDQAMLDVRIGFSPEPAGLEVPWRQLTQLGTNPHKTWNDAYLQAFATAAGLQVVTFDAGFRQFPGFNGTFLP